MLAWQQCSQFLRCSEFVFEMLRIFMRCSEFFWDALNFFWDALNFLLRCSDFCLRCSEWPQWLYHPSCCICATATTNLCKLWSFGGKKNCALLAVTPLRCITSDQFIRSTEIKWRFCPFHCMHFDTLGHSDTSMYLIYEVSLKMAIWLTLNWLFQVSYDIEMEHIFKSEFSRPIFITVFLVENAVNAAAPEVELSFHRKTSF